MVLGSCFNGGDFSLQPAVDLGGGLRTGVVEVKRMPREGESLKVVSIRTVHFLPSLHGRPLHLHVTLGFWVTLRPPISPRVLAEDLLGFLQLLAGVSHRPSQGEGRAL